MGRPITEGRHRPNLEAYKLDISHQEVDRLVTELQNLYNSFAYNDEGPSGVEWLPVHGTAHLLCGELGYEDVDELEDALKGSFSEFLDCLPNVEKRSEPEGKEYFKLLPEPGRETWQDTRWTFTVASTQDLWRVCMKSAHARIEIPELEFEISADGKRKIDTIYNHIASAVYNLGTYVRQARDSLSEEHSDKILDTVLELNRMLDVEQPFTWIMHDPSGLSDIKPDADVKVEHPGAAAAAEDREAAEDGAAAAPTAEDGVAAAAAAAMEAQPAAE